MSAPTADKILPPVVFLMSLLGVFIVLVGSMAPTISENQQSRFTGPGEPDVPEYMDMFTNATYEYWIPNPYFQNGTDNTITTFIGHTWLNEGDEPSQRFESSSEANHPIIYFAIRGHLTDMTKNRMEYAFSQSGGWLGMKTWHSKIAYPIDFEEITTNSTTGPNVVAYAGMIHLRHEYQVIFTGYLQSSDTLDEQIRDWQFNITLRHVRDTNASASPWVIVGQFFSLRLPGIPAWLNALLIMPLMVMVAICAYVLIRGALPW